MREYLEVLEPLLQGNPMQYAGEHYRVNTGVEVNDAKKPVPLSVAALGSRMLEAAGTLSGGTILWMTRARTIENHIVSTIERAASDARDPLLGWSWGFR